MKKTLLTERFQQLAGIKPLYPTRNQINEGVIDNLMDKVEDFGVNSMEKIKSVVGSIISPMAKSNEGELETIAINNPELTQDLGKLEDLQNNIEAFLRDYEVGVDTDLNEARGSAAGMLGNISAGFGSISAGMWMAVGAFGFGKEETISNFDKAKNLLGKGLDYFDWTSGTIEQTLPDVEFLYGSPEFYAYMLAASVALKLIVTFVKDKQTNENAGADIDTIIGMHLNKI